MTNYKAAFKNRHLKQGPFITQVNSAAVYHVGGSLRPNKVKSSNAQADGKTSKPCGAKRINQGDLYLRDGCFVIVLFASEPLAV